MAILTMYSAPKALNWSKLRRSWMPAAGGPAFNLDNGTPPTEGSPKSVGQSGAPTQLVHRDTLLINPVALWRGVLLRYRSSLLARHCRRPAW